MRKWNRRSRVTAAGSLAAVTGIGLLAGCSAGNNASHPDTAHGLARGEPPTRRWP